MEYKYIEDYTLIYHDAHNQGVEGLNNGRYVRSGVIYNLGGLN